jgi:hypothetical protein
MPTAGEHKTVQARILAYAQAIGWTYVPRGEAEKRRGFDHTKAAPTELAAEVMDGHWLRKAAMEHQWAGLAAIGGGGVFGLNWRLDCRSPFQG